ncbi:MAG: hypothetical protein CSA03_01870 [Bacteroidetes bacterium]|nr:MAG: hypothetical protein CSA03_01870 [Bacteroidota bacterium]
MERKRLYKLIIAVLVILNIGLVVFMFLSKSPHPGPPPHEGILARELGIEGEHVAKIDVLEKEHHREKQALMKKDRELHETLFSKIGTDEDVTSLQAEIEKNHAQIEKMTYDFFNEVAMYCTKEQRAELKETIYHAFHQMRGPRR